MAYPEQDPQPDVEIFSYAGCDVTMIDADGILASAREQRVELLRDASFPSPVQQVRFAVGPDVRDGEQVQVLDAEVSTGGPAPMWDRLGPTVLGNDPIGALLARRLAAGDPWAIRIVDGVGTAAAGAYRWLGLGRPGKSGDPRTGDPRRGDPRTGDPRTGDPKTGDGGAADPERPGPTVLEDPALGLRATVTYEEPPASVRSLGSRRIVGVRAAVPRDDITPAHLQAMFTLVLRVVAELVGDGRSGPGPLAGRSYVLAVGNASRGTAGGTGSGRTGTGTGTQDATPSTESSERVTLDQVGGLPDVVAQFRQIAVSFRHPQVMARWGARRPQGILMYGPPGTGKTMLARALANEIGARFREVRTPEIIDKWLGASERNIKRIFRDARRYREPTVMLFDEFDSIISYVGPGGDAASQAVNAVAGIFKQEMNTLIEENPNVIVVATTNFPDRVDDSLIRSGRFDVKIAIPLPNAAGRSEIVATMIRDLRARHEESGFRMFADDIDPVELGRATGGMTGADIKEVLRRVRMTKAMTEARTGTVGPITQADLLATVTELRQAGAAS